ncbi:MAG: RraA family protein [Geminicoccaceae bacterium]|nr:MAG: RraA family protein [Geminicoccaceae bacterium]
MSVHTHTITLHRRFERASAELILAFGAAPTGNICDAQGRQGALDPAIRPVTAPCRFAGTAVTVASAPGDNLAPYAALEVAKPGDVLVIATNAYRGAAIIGDVFVGMAKNRGIVGIVTDGMVRDRDGLDALGLPVFAAGLTPNSPWKNGPGSVGAPVVVGGRAIASGDLVVADFDGVVTVPLVDAAQVQATLRGVVIKEAEMEQAVARGADRPGWLADLRQAGVIVDAD